MILGEDVIFNDFNLKPRALRVDDKNLNPYYIDDDVHATPFSKKTFAIDGSFL